MKLIWRLSIILLCCSLHLNASAQTKVTNPVDPIEKWNRFIFAFNTDVDHLTFRPLAIVYSTITPPPLQKGVTNFFANIQEITVFPNDILQGKIKFALVDVVRFGINTTLGIGGLFDIATRMGLPKHYEDFGMTMAYWNGNRTQSAYFVLPIIGPSTFRDTTGLVFDYLASPWPYVRPRWVPLAGYGIYAINLRAQLLPADKLVKQSFDPYIFVRSAFLQKRSALIQANTQKAPGDSDAKVYVDADAGGKG